MSAGRAMHCAMQRHRERLALLAAERHPVLAAAIAATVAAMFNRPVSPASPEPE